MKNARHADDSRPLDETSDCPATRDYSRACIHHLVKAGEALGAMLLTWSNLYHYQQIMGGARRAIAAADYAGYVAEARLGWASADAEAV